MTSRPNRGGGELPREEALARVLETYERYETTGYARRWHGTAAGSILAAQEVDAWLAAAIGPDAEVVDLGCGAGRVARSLEAQGVRPRRYVGIDLIPSRIAVAARNLPWAEFIEASADRVPLPDGCATVVTASTLLSSVLDDAMRQAVAWEVQRLVRSGGRFVVYDVRYPSPGNPNVRPVPTRVLSRLFPGWHLSARTLTVLPPLARTRLAGGPRRYAALAAIPVLRSHIGAVLVKP